MDVRCSLHCRLPSRITTWPVFSSGLFPACLIVCPLLTIDDCRFLPSILIMSYCSCAPHKFVLPLLFLIAQGANRRASKSACGPDVIQGYVSLFYLLRSSHRRGRRGNGSHPVMERWESAAPVLCYPEPIDPSVGHSPPPPHR